MVDVATNSEFAIVKVLTTSAFNRNLTTVRRVTDINDEWIAVRTSEIEKPCVHVKVQGDCYITIFPNLLHY